MGWAGRYMLDPSDIETRFAIEDGMSYMASIFTEPSEEDLEKIDLIRSIMDSLPPREADFVDLYYFKRKKQTEIAYLFACSQPTVCYRLQRATARIQFLLQLPEVTEADLLGDMESFLPETLDSQIMLLMWKTTCQSEVAKQLDVSQGLVRHRFLRSIKRMRQFVETSKEYEELEDLRRLHVRAAVPSDKMEIQAQMRQVRTRISQALRWVPEPLRETDPEKYSIYVKLFEFIYANKNILREVSRPSWDTRVARVVDPFPV